MTLKVSWKGAFNKYKFKINMLKKRIVFTKYALSIVVLRSLRYQGNIAKT